MPSASGNRHWDDAEVDLRGEGAAKRIFVLLRDFRLAERNEPPPALGSEEQVDFCVGKRVAGGEVVPRVGEGMDLVFEVDHCGKPRSNVAPVLHFGD